MHDDATHNSNATHGDINSEDGVDDVDGDDDERTFLCFIYREKYQALSYFEKVWKEDEHRRQKKKPIQHNTDTGIGEKNIIKGQIKSEICISAQQRCWHW